MLHTFILAGNTVRLWQNAGESYEHVLMKALGYTMFIGDYPNLQIETKIGMRYKPDLIAADESSVDFWGECGINSIRKTLWIMKHTETKKLVLFKIGRNVDSLIKKLREEVPLKYRPETRLSLVNFVPGIIDLTATKQIATVSEDWFTSIVI